MKSLIALFSLLLDLDFLLSDEVFTNQLDLLLMFVGELLRNIFTDGILVNHVALDVRHLLVQSRGRLLLVHFSIDKHPVVDLLATELVLHVRTGNLAGRHRVHLGTWRNLLLLLMQRLIVAIVEEGFVRSMANLLLSMLVEHGSGIVAHRGVARRLVHN